MDRNVLFRGQKRVVSLVGADRKATLTQMTDILECTTHPTLRWMVYISQGPCQVPLLSAQNRILRLPLIQIHQHWTAQHDSDFNDHQFPPQPEIMWCSYVNKEQSLREKFVFCGINEMKIWGCFRVNGGFSQYECGISNKVHAERIYANTFMTLPIAKVMNVICRAIPKSPKGQRICVKCC